MKLAIILIAFLLVIIFINACGGSSNNSTNGTTKFTLGKELYVSKCTACHKSYEPALHTNDEWQKILDDMGIKAKLTSGEKQLILNYLKENN